MDIAIVSFSGLMALMITVIIVPFANKLAFVINAVDVPSERKIHTKPMPSLGGLAISISFSISALICLEFNPVFKAFLVGLIVITITGVIDDIWHIPSPVKFAGEIAASLLFIYLSGIVIVSFGDLIGTGSIGTGRYAIPVTVFCMVGVINALNFADGLDGLAGGICAVACLFLAYFSFISGNQFYLILIVAIFGSLIGFLYYNRYPAKVFMGDTGSLVLGYILSVICILLVQATNGSSLVLPISMAIVMGLPIVDTVLVMTNRMLHGKSPFKPDKIHLHDRLLSLGFKHTTVVYIIYAGMFSCGMLAILIQDLEEYYQFTIGVVYASLLFGSIYFLNNIKYKLP